MVDVPEGFVRCSTKVKNWQCKSVFPASDICIGRNKRPVTRCKDCREKSRKQMARLRKTPEGKAVMAKRWQKYRNSDHGKAVIKAKDKKYMASEAGKATKKKSMDAWRLSEHGKNVRHKTYEIYKKTANGAAKRAASDTAYKASDRCKEKMENNKMSRRIRQRIYKLVNKIKSTSRTLQKYTFLPNGTALRSHFKSTWAPWMNWNNYGAHVSGCSYRTSWQIGHRIPCAVYDHTKREDIRRCHSLQNLFAQDAKENIEMKDTLPCKEELDQLKAVWPTAWLCGDSSDELVSSSDPDSDSD